MQERQEEKDVAALRRLREANDADAAALCEAMKHSYGVPAALEHAGTYATVVIDPPWPVDFSGKPSSKETFKTLRRQSGAYPGKANPRHPSYTAIPYRTLSVDDIKGLPVGDILDADAWVFLWTTQRFLPVSFGVLDAWGLAYCCTFTWHKIWGVKPFNRPMYSSEFCILGAEGKAEVHRRARVFHGVHLAESARA